MEFICNGNFQHYPIQQQVSIPVKNETIELKKKGDYNREISQTNTTKVWRKIQISKTGLREGGGGEDCVNFPRIVIIIIII